MIDMYLTLSFVEVPAERNIYNIYKNINNLSPQRHTTLANDENQNNSSSFHLGFNPGQDRPCGGQTGNCYDCLYNLGTCFR